MDWLKHRAGLLSAAIFLLFGLLPAGAWGRDEVVQEHQEPWFDGGMEAAQAAAKAEHKPLLIYWGAVWCPPCNELKSEVFSQPRFRELVQHMVAVQLDGDSDEAQAWASKLHAAGYPTVLLLGSQGEELLRLNVAVSLEEFASALNAAVTAGKSFTLARQAALAGQAQAADWRLLARQSGDELPSGKALVQALAEQAELISKVPTDLVAERELLKAQALALGAALAEEPDLVAEAKAKQELGRIWLADLLHDPAAAVRTRAVLIDNGPAILHWLYHAQSPAQTAADKTWLQTMGVLAGRSELSADMRFSAEVAAFELWQKRHPGLPLAVPKALRLSVQDAVARLQSRAKTPYQRQASLSGAAQLLAASGDPSGAKKLLLGELKNSATPWYYQSALASLAESQQKHHEALEWSAKARQSVRGQASRLQWIASDLLLNLKLKGPTPQVQALVKEYYDTALSLSDGFQGRNAGRASKVLKGLSSWSQYSELKPMLAAYAQRCQSPGCKEHFAQL